MMNYFTQKTGLLKCPVRSLTLILLIFTANLSFGQTIYNEGFGASAVNATTLLAGPPSWTRSGANAANIQLLTTSVSSGYSGASGSANLTDNAGTGTGIVTTGNISTVGFANPVTVTFGYRSSSASYTGAVLCEYSVNGGGAWTTLSSSTTGATPTAPLNTVAPGAWGLTLPLSLTGAAGITNLQFRFTFTRSNASGNFRIDDFKVTGTASTPSLSITTAGIPSKFYSITGVPSDVYAFTVTGSSLGTNNVSVGAVTGFEYSTNVTGPFSGSLTLTPTAGAVNATVYVRMAAGATGSVSGTCTVSCPVTASQTVNLAGQKYGLGSSFTPGNLVVLRVMENGVAVAASAAAPAFLDELTPTGTLVQSIPLPFVPNGLNRRMTISSSSTSDGVLNLSPDGQYLTFVGYDAPVFTAGVTGSAVASTNRIVGLVSSTGAINSTTRINDAYDGNNARSAVTLDGTSFWTSGAGTGGGTRYMPLGNTITSTYVSTAPANTRVVNISNNNLYVSSASGANIGLNQVGTSGLPTSTGNVTSLIISGIADAYGFVFLDRSAVIPGNDVVYIANNNAGLLKYYFNGTNWVAAGVVASSSIIGITAQINGSNNVDIYCVGNAAGNIYKITDSGAYNASLTGTLTSIFTATAGTSLRGVSFTPVAIPVPDIDHTFSTPAPATIAQGAADQPLYRVQADISISNATITGATFTTAGTYAASDFSNFKLFSSADGTLDGSDIILGAINSSTGPGQSLAFTGLGQVLPVGTRYLFVSASASGCAAIGGTINITSTPLSAITYTSSNKTGTSVAGTSKSIVTGTLANVTGLTATSGTPVVQVSWTNPTCFDQFLIVAHTASISGTPSGTVYSSNLNYSIAPAFAGGGKVVYYGTSSPQSISGLTSGTNYFFKVFVRKGSSWSSGVQVSATPLSPTLYSVATGVAGTDAIWSLSPAGAPATAASLGGFNQTTSVRIQAGTTVTFAASSINMFNLTIDNGGVMTSGVTSNTYMNINGTSITNNGILGSILNDGISFNIEGVNVTWSGTGTNNVARIRKNATTNTFSTLIFNTNATLSFPGVALYCAPANTALNVTINAGKTVSFIAAGLLGSLAFDGQTGADPGEIGGVITVNGTLNLTGKLTATTNNINPLFAPSLTIGASGRINCKDADISIASAGTGLPFTITPGGRLTVTGKMRMLSGTLNSNNGVYLTSGASLLHGAGTVDGVTPCSGTVNGNINVRRQGATALAEYNYWSSPVAGATNSSIMSGASTGANSFEYNPANATGSDAAGLRAGWISRTAGQIMDQGKGYIATNGGNASFTGTPYEGTLVLPLQSGVFTKFNLVGNPYPSSISATSLLNGNTGQVIPALHFWDDDGTLGAGYSTADYVTVNSLGAASGGNGTAASFTGAIASGQGFFVEAAGTSNTITFNNSMRNANATNFFEVNEGLQRVWIKIQNPAGVSNETLIAFLPEATNDYDLIYDAKKLPGNEALSLFTPLAGEAFAIQAWPVLNGQSIIPLGLTSVLNGAHTFSISRIDNIDPTVIVYLEDTQTGILHNLSRSGYSFNLSEGLFNSDRFRIRFSKPTVVTTATATCSSNDGAISISSEENLWNYSVISSENQIVASGISEENYTISGLAPGLYSILLTTADQYELSLSAEVLGTETVSVDLSQELSATVDQPVTFAAITNGAEVMTWNFGDGTDNVIAVQPTHIYSEAGIYNLTVTASNESCSSTVSQFVSVTTTTGIGAINSDTFNLFPNPASGQITINGISSEGNLTIYDLTGKQLNTYPLNGTIKTINVSSLANGIYIASIQANGSIKSVRLVIAR